MTTTNTFTPSFDVYPCIICGSHGVSTEGTSCSSCKDTLTNKDIPTKEEATTMNKAINITNTVKSTVVDKATSIMGVYTRFTDSKLYAFISKHVRTTMSFLDGHKKAIAVGAFSTVAGGLVTTGVVSAVAAGVAISTLTMVVACALAKKKNKDLSYKTMLTKIGISAVTAIVFPTVLLGAVYGTVYATWYAAILPYAAIVA
jgi:hypothetical protein